MKKYLIIALAIFLGLFTVSLARLNNPPIPDTQIISSGAIDMTEVTSTLLFTNNTGKTFVVESVATQILTADTISGDAASIYLYNSDADGVSIPLDNMFSAAHGTSMFGRMIPFNADGSSGGSIYAVQSGKSLYFAISSGATANAYTAKIVVSGFYY